MTNTTSQSRGRSAYDSIAPHYDKAVRPLDRWFLARLRANTLNYLPPGARVLELGAGTGLNFVFYPTNATGVASEPNNNMLRLASAKERPDKIQLVQSCAEQLPFKNNSFDAAFATLVFCSVAQPEAAFSELRRVVKPGGTVLLLEHVRPGGLFGSVFAKEVKTFSAMLCASGPRNAASQPKQWLSIRPKLSGISSYARR